MTEMDRSKIYQYSNGKFTLVAVEGIAIPLRDGSIKYRGRERYKGVDFSPVVIGSHPGEDFMVANVYGDKFLTLTAVQDKSLGKRLRTSFVSNGNGNHALDFLIDLSEVFELEPVEPSRELIQSARVAFMPLASLYEQALKKLRDSKAAARIISEALRLQQSTYVRDARVEKYPHN